MKNLLLVLIVVVAIVACKDSDKGEAGSTSIQWIDSTFHDIGKVEKGTKVEIVYHFKNTGDKNLIISNVKAQCGCTVPSFPKEPFAPGKGGEIKAEFNSEGQIPGEHRKYVDVTANTNPQTSQLTFRVEVTDSTSK